jgi:hypothetical protein
MASTPVVPSAPAAAAPAPAAPPAAPAAAAPPAPTSAPVASPPPTATPAAGVPPAAPAGPQPPAKLNASEYGNAVESYQAEVTWRQQLEDFKAANPGVEIKDDSPWAGTEAPPAEVAPVADAPAAEAPKVDDKAAEAEVPAAEAETYSLDEAPTITPQMMNDILKGDETLKAAIEANPAAKGAIMKLAREHAELSQFKGIFPTAESAKFSRETSARTVALRNQFRMAETPENMAGAFDSFMQEFAVTGPDGKQVMDAQGQPVYGDDLYMFTEHVIDRYANNTLEEVESRLAANKYGSDAERERDNDMKLALSIVKDDLHPSTSPKADPDLSSLAPDARAEVQARLDEAKRIEAANAATAGGSAKQDRAKVYKEGTAKFFAEAGNRTFTQAKQIVEKLRAAGAVIPQWQLDAKVPGQNYSAFDNAIGMEIENYIKADPFETNKQQQLELQYLASPTPENMQERIKAFDAVLQSRDESGRSLLNRIVTKLVRKHGAEVQGAAEAGRVDTPPAASKEPTQGPAVKPQVLSSADAWKAAENQLAKENKDWHSLTDTERMSQIFGRQRQVLAAG